MKNDTLLPADIYQVINKSLLSELDKLVLNLLYMPIIGNNAVTLYLTLYNDLKSNSFMSLETTHYHLMTIMNLSLIEIKESRKKLEGIGLLRSYLLQGNINSYVYELYSPLSVSEFVSHPVFNVTLYTALGKEEYNNIMRRFELPHINLKDYIEVTDSFDMTYKVKEYSEMFEKKSVVSKEKLKLNYETDFDFDLLISSIKNFSNKALNKSTKELITNLSFLYEIDAVTMTEIIKTCINENGLIDKDCLRKSVRKFYQFNNDGRLPSLMFKSQPGHLKSVQGDNTNRGKIINVFETTSPYDFLKSKYHGVRPTRKDLELLEYLLIDMKLTPAVINVLVDYVLKTNNNKLTRGYVEVIASQWVRSKVETAKEAMQIAEKEHKKFKKVKTVSKYEEKNTPIWFNKDIKSKEMSEEENKEFESILKEFNR